MANITVLTPTYNRYERLKKLYDSLLRQDNKNFIWIVIDDGSSDDTDKMVSSWKGYAPFRIEYYKKKNGGKHTALNYAYAYTTTPLIFIVDSDDWLMANAISVIEDRYRKFGQDTELCGFSFLRGKPDGGYLSSSSVPEDGMKETYCECRINRHISGDMAEVWYTHCLKEHLFPEFQGEKFIGEDVVWVRLAEKYKMRFFNDVIYVSDYLPDGLTSNRRKHNIASPNGCVERALTFLNAEIKLEYKVKAMLQYEIYGRFARKRYSELFLNQKNKVLFLMMFPFSVLIYIYWEKKYKEKSAFASAT